MRTHQMPKEGVCPGVGQTMRDEKMVYFCTAIVDPKERKYSTDALLVCPITGGYCKGLLHSIEAENANMQQLQSGGHRSPDSKYPTQYDGVVQGKRRHPG